MSKLLLNSIPKSGTHLVSKLLTLLGLVPVTDRYLNSAAERRPRDVRFLADGAIETQDSEVPMAGTACGINSQAAYERFMETTFRGADLPYFIQGHHLWSAASSTYMAANDIRLVVVLRDPRAVALSHINWILGPNAGHPLHSLYRDLPMRERFHHEFRGVPADSEHPHHRHLPMLPRYRNMARWGEANRVCFLGFEQIVGAPGGGDPALQQRTIERLAAFIGVDTPDIPTIQQALWGGTATFHSGRIDAWQEFAADFPTELTADVDEILGIINRCLDTP